MEGWMVKKMLVDGELDETGSALDEQILDGMRWMKTRMEPVPSNERFRLDGPGLLDEQQMKPVPFWMDGWKLDGSWMDGQNLDGIWMEFGWNLDGTWMKPVPFWMERWMVYMTMFYISACDV